MNIIEYIAIGIAFGIESMIVMYRHARPNGLRLTQGLMASLLFAVIYAILAFTGILIGSMLHFDDMINPNSEAYSTTNALVYVGLTVVVVIKMLLAMHNEKKETKTIVYDIRRVSTVVALAIATGINLLIIYLGVGFADGNSHKFITILLPLIISVFLLSYLGIMFGRQQVALRPRRWQYVISILLLAIAIYHVINS